MAVETPTSQASAAAPAQSQPLRTLDFTSHALLRQATTMLRRVWLLDPPLTDAELADATTVQECLRAMCEAIGNGITADAADSKWDHELWRKHTQLKLLDAAAPAAAAAQPPDLASVVSPWREEIYDIYRHVFSDLWRALVAETAAAERGGLGRYDPGRGDAVSLVVLPAEEKKVDKTAFVTDTFLYPVWVNPRATVTFAAGGTRHVWAAGEEATWTTGLWVQAGRDVALTTEMEGLGGDQTGIAAVFVTGHCEERGGRAPEETRTAAGDSTAAAGASTAS